MSCITLESIALGCERNSGGLHQIIIGEMDAVTSQVVTAGVITAMVVGVPPIQIEVKRKTSNYVEDHQEDFVAGSSVVTATVTAMLHRRDADKSRKLNILSAGQRYLYGILKDANGLFWYFPYLQYKSTGEGSGQERADGSKYAVVLIAENEQLAYEVEASVVAGLL